MKNKRWESPTVLVTEISDGEFVRTSVEIDTGENGTPIVSVLVQESW